LIGIALSQPSNLLNEAFYFDKSKLLFFSIHVTDYLMIDEDLYVEPNKINFRLSREEQTKILDWICRIDSDDQNLIQIPQKGLVDERVIEIEARQFLSEHAIDIQNTRIWEIASDNVADAKQSRKRLKWWQFWN